MSEKILKTRILLRNDETANWLNNQDTVLKKGEAGVEFLANGKTKIKIGDGVKKWSELPYVDGEDIVKAQVFQIEAQAEQDDIAAIATAVGDAVLQSGDIVIIKKVKVEKLNQGDVITFTQEGEVITHRITKIDVEESGTKYITKGDNNNTEDTIKVEHEDILGKEILTIPQLGKVMQLLNNKIILLIIILIILIWAFIRIQKKEKLENRREKKKIEENKKNKI